jgi:predicted RNA-binding Zn-ribbon protein involved in translation (DUF1610 family)
MVRSDIMEYIKPNGTYCESNVQEEWFGHYYECNECGQRFMLSEDSDKCYCPGCGRYLIWNEAADE